MTSAIQLRVLRTSLRASPSFSPIRNAPGLLSNRRHVPPCLETSAAPRCLSTTSLLLARAATQSSPPIQQPELRPNYALSPTAANPPATTRPPPLNLPTREPDQGTFSFYFATGKAYLTFYKTGLKNIYLNTRLVWSLNAAGGIPRADTPASPGGSEIATPPTIRAVGSTTRATLLLRRRWRYDVRRLPLFALLLLICGEFTPFVVMALPSLVPYTCRIPRQIESLQRKAEARRAASFRRLEEKSKKDATHEGNIKGAQATAVGRSPEGKVSSKMDGISAEPPVTAHLTNAEVDAHIARSLNLISPLWDRLGLPDAALTLLSARRRVKQHVAYLREDDALLVQAGGVDALEREEVVLACMDRAIETVERSDEDLRARLRHWLRYVPEHLDSTAQAQRLTDRLLSRHD